MAEPKHHTLIKHFEQCRLTAYQCGAGIWTIGYGHTASAKPGQVITQERADALFAWDVARFEEGVSRLVTNLGLLPQHLGALTSFAFNLGLDEDADTVAEGLGDSTLLKLVNKGDFLAASREFVKWDRTKGVKTWGLHRRRLAEAHLFLTGELKLDWNRASYGF